jgi:predicted PurR-regulated permease PerM
MTVQKPPAASPTWSSTTKTIVGLTMIAIVAAMLVKFHNIIAPLLLAFILAYLLHPLASRLSNVPRISWRASVSLIYLALVILLAGLLTYAGFQIVQQLQSVVQVVDLFINSLPARIADLATLQIKIGPFTYTGFADSASLNTLTQQILQYVQPLLGRAGGLVSTFATGTLSTLGWLLFILIVSYFLLADASQVSREIVRVDLPGLDNDLRRIGNELSRIWNSFLRGQVIIFMLVVLAYTTLLLILGLRYAFGIAILAGLARFVPYLGPFITWTVTGLVAYFQGSNYFSLEPWQYTLLVIVCCVLLDQVFDYMVVPRFFNTALGVHPAALLVAAIIAAGLLGVVGLVLAAPVLATMMLFTKYVVRKMFDLDPWPPDERPPKVIEMPWVRVYRRIRAWLRVRLRKPA